MLPTNTKGADRGRGTWVLLLAFGYAAAYLLIHLGTPLGRVPVLDGREILALANALSNGEWPGEPFFRAPLYPMMLAGLRVGGVPESNLMLAAQVLNLLAHTVSAWLVFKIAFEVWQQQGAALISGLLFALYPLAVFYIGEPLDIVVGLCFFLGSILNALRATRSPGFRQAFAAGLLLALAVATRPHFLAAAIGLLWIPLLLGHCRSTRWRQLVAMTTGLVLGMSSVGALNAWQSGQFQMLPSQGAYNLWAANRPGANGLYYEQLSNFHSQDQQANPARLESERLYQEATGQSAAEVHYAEIARYWRNRAIIQIRSQPLDWLTLELRKLAALLHNTEQYNNKTFAFHKQRSDALQFNPLGWGLLLIMAMAGVLVGWRRSALQTLLLVGACYAAGVLMFYASARFRFPLVSLLCVGAGGLAIIAQQWRSFTTARVLPRALLLASLGGFVFFPFQWSRASDTFDQDRLLLARAQARLGLYQDSIELLDQVLARRRDWPLAWDMQCSARFNDLRERADAQRLLALPAAIDACERVAGVSAQADWILAFEWWLSGDRQRARHHWRRIAAARGTQWQRALACLLLSGDRPSWHDPGLADLPTGSMNDLLLLARWLGGDAGAGQVLHQRHTTRAVADEISWLQQVFEIEDWQMQ